MSTTTHTPASLTRDDDDATIFDVMFAQTWLRTREAGSIRQIWSRTQARWLSEAEYAREWRHASLYNQIMGSSDVAVQMNREGL